MTLWEASAWSLMLYYYCVSLSFIKSFGFSTWEQNPKSQKKIVTNNKHHSRRKKKHQKKKPKRKRKSLLQGRFLLVLYKMTAPIDSFVQDDSANWFQVQPTEFPPCSSFSSCHCYLNVAFDQHQITGNLLLYEITMLLFLEINLMILPWWCINLC